MELYKKPQHTSYVTGLSRRFLMPVEGGDPIPAVAVSANAGNLWNSGYTILVVLLFAAAGKIVMDVVTTYFPLRHNGNRHAILVAFVNTADAIAAMLLFLCYQWKLLFRIQTTATAKGVPNTHLDGWKRVDWPTFGLVTFLLLVHVAIFGGGNAAGIIIPGHLMMGHVAIANPNAIFYPEILNLDSKASQRESNARLSTIAAIRAIGTVQYSERTLRERVKFNTDAIRKGPGGRPELLFKYSYNLTGFDFGLQRATGLTHIVRGRCQTEYS